MNKSERKWIGTQGLLTISIMFILGLFLCPRAEAIDSRLSLDEGGSSTVTDQAILKDSSPTAMVYFNIVNAVAAQETYRVDQISVSVTSISGFTNDMIEYVRIYQDTANDNTLTVTDGLLSTGTSTRFPFSSGSTYTFTGLNWTIPASDLTGLIVTAETSDTISDITSNNTFTETSFTITAAITDIDGASEAGPTSAATPVSGKVTAECEAIDYTPTATYYATLPDFSFTVPEENARLRPDAQTTTLERQTISLERSQLLPMETNTAVLGLDIAGVNETLSSVTVHFSRPRDRNIGARGEIDQTFDGDNYFDPSGTVDFNLDGINDNESGFDWAGIYADTNNNGTFDEADTLIWTTTSSFLEVGDGTQDDTWTATLSGSGIALESTYDNQPDYFVVIRADSGFWDGANQDGSGVKFGASFKAWIDNSDVNFGTFISSVTPNPSEPCTLEDFIVDADGNTTTTLPDTGDYDIKYANLTTFTGVGTTDDVYYVDDDNSGTYTFGDDLFYDRGNDGRYDAETDTIILIERGSSDPDDISIADNATGNTMPTSAITHTAGGQTYILAYYDADGDGSYDLGEDIIRDDNVTLGASTQRYWNPERGLGLTSQAVDHIIDADGGRNPSSDSDTNSFSGDVSYSADPKYPPLTAFVAGDNIHYIDTDGSGSYRVHEVIFLDNGDNAYGAGDTILVNVHGYSGTDLTGKTTPGVETAGTNLYYYDADRDGVWDIADDAWNVNGEDIVYSVTDDVAWTGRDQFYQPEVKTVNAVYEVHDLTGKRVDATSSVIPVLGINAADTANTQVINVADPKIQSIRVDFEKVPGFEPSRSNDVPNDVDGDSDLAPLTDDMTSGISLWKDNKSSGNVGVMDPVIDLIIDADGGSKTDSTVWGAGTPGSDDTKSDGDTLTQFTASDNIFFVDMDDDGNFSLGDGLFLDNGDNQYNASTDTIILRWKGDRLGFADGNGTTGGAGTDNYPNAGELELFDSNDNVYWADVDGSGTWTQLSGQEDGLWKSGGTENTTYNTAEGDVAIIAGDMVSGATTGVQLTADHLFAYDDDEVTNNSAYDNGEDIHYANAIDAAGDLRLRYNDENGDGNYDNGEDIIYDGDADGQWDDPHDTFIKTTNPTGDPLEWVWDSDKSIWYIILKPDEPQDLHPDDDFTASNYEGDDYFICILTDDDITYEDKIQVTIPNYPSPGGVGIDNDDAFFARAGVQFTTGGGSSENADGSEVSTRVLSAHMPVFLQDLTYNGQEVVKSSSDVPVLGINLFNDSGRTVTLDGIMIELYNQGEYGAGETDKFNPNVDLYNLNVAHDGVDNDGDGYTDDYNAILTPAWDPDLTETRMAGVVVYQDTNGNGKFDGYSTDNPIRLYQAPTFVGDTGEPTQLALYFHNDFVSNAAVPLTRNTQVPTTKDSKADYFIVLRTSANIDNGDDFSVGIVGWGPLGSAWADDSALIFSEGVNSVYPPWSPPVFTRGYLESRSYEKIETQVMTADIVAPAIPTGFTVTAGFSENTLNWTNPSDTDFVGIMIRYIENPSPVETYPVQNANGTFTGTQAFGGTFGGNEAIGQTVLTLSESDTTTKSDGVNQVKLSDWFTSGDTLKLGPNKKGQTETVIISSVGTDNGTTTVTVTSGTTYAYESGDPFTTATTSVTHLRSSIAGLYSGTRYNYAIFAYDNVPGNPNKQNFSLGVTATATPKLSPVTSFAATGGNSQVVLTWTDPTDGDFKNVLIVRDTADPTGTTPTDGTTYADDIASPFAGGLNSYWTKSVAKGTQTYTDTTVTNGTRYYYRAYAYDSTPDYSTGVSANTLPSSDVTAPSALTDFTATAGNANVTLTWTDPSESDFNSILIVRDTTDPSGTTPSKGTLYSDDTSTPFTAGLDSYWTKNVAKGTQTYTDSSLTNGTKYYYRAYAYDEVYNYSTAATANATPQIGDVSPVTNFSAVAGDGLVSLSWINPSDIDYAGTLVVRKTGGYPSNSGDGTVVRNDSGASLAGASRSWTDNYQISNGTTYYYTAFAYNAAPTYSSAVSSAQGYATPTATVSEGSGGGGGGCFIATAAYGTPLAEEVQVLSSFRDECLLKTQFGRRFVSIYYKIGPIVAREVEKSPTLKSIVRAALKPLISLCKVRG